MRTPAIDVLLFCRGLDEHTLQTAARIIWGTAAGTSLLCNRQRRIDPCASSALARNRRNSSQTFECVGESGRSSHSRQRKLLAGDGSADSHGDCAFMGRYQDRRG